MVKVFEGTKNEYYMDGYMVQNLDTAKKVIKDDWDMIFVYDGNEGSGKSVKAMQDAFYCDPTFNLDRVVFTPEDLKEAIIKSKPYQSLVFDEGYRGLSSRAAMSMINKTLVKMLAEIRQKNLFVFVVLPSIFDLDKYVAIWRSRALIHIYTGKNFQRGFFSFYNSERKKQLYVLGKKYYSYGKPKANFIGRFTNHYVLDEKEYRKKKKESLANIEKKPDKVEERELENKMFDRVMKMPDDVPHVVKMKLLNMHKATYFRKKKKYELGSGYDVEFDV